MNGINRPPNPNCLTNEQIRQESEAWFQRQMAILEKVHGKRWPDHRDWLEEYLKAELRERLLACGWRPKR